MKLESKLQLTTQGYINRAAKLEQTVLASYELLEKATVELSKFVNGRNHSLFIYVLYDLIFVHLSFVLFCLQIVVSH